MTAPPIFRTAGTLAWAWELRDREINHGGELSNGRMMTQYHRDSWRMALRHGKYALPNSAAIEHVPENGAEKDAE